MKMHPVVHFEMPAKDKKRTKKFYETAFGWQMVQTGPEFGDYLLATTTPVDKNNMHLEKGAINGGFYEYGPYGKTPHFVISVDDIEAHMKIVKKAGGKVTGKPQDIPNIGKFVMCKDTEGNNIGMLQPTKR